MRDKIILGNVLDVLKTLPSESVYCVITSPPYYHLRDYGIENTIWGGDENCQHDFKLDEFDNPCFRSGGGQFNDNGIGAKMTNLDKKHKAGFCKKCNAWSGSLGLEPNIDLFIKNLCDIFDEVKRVLKKDGSIYVNLGDTYENKSLIQVPSRFAIEMTERGWKLRSELIWHKPSCMPCSASDRYTTDFEKIFFFTKSNKYYFEMPFENTVDNLGKRNRRCVWSVNAKTENEEHFAAYPSELVSIPIKASCPEFVCKKCGKPRMKQYDVDYKVQAIRNENEKYFKPDDKLTKKNMKKSAYKILKEKEMTDCGCGAGFEKGIVLDIFSGTGTTAYQAMILGRNYLGIEINPEYKKISDKRLSQQTII